ncbi:hypothetical protein GHT07_03750 [Caenimonas koreensis DSM 17982]|uniref:Uncharacterized protein n=1 Tax=Caenimonas koreensis DSM 17982 TaxID=1121255 RepID=A0A844B4B6_9BURK|nr:hypothetical protein [Caenimonas koreensis]MRD46377.1 hypothetical protein [Caenimonas koreensis DSM 17982]
MQSGPRDVAQIRLDNALALFEEFLRSTVKDPDVATLRGLERRFAERLQIQPSYWSQIKSRSRQIGERLARQFEQLSHKPYGWMDTPHDGSAADAALSVSQPAATAAPAESSLPIDDDERFIVGLVLTYYRRHPQRARARLMDLLGEVLMTPGAKPSPSITATNTPPKPGTPAPSRASVPMPQDDPLALWQRVQTGVAPLKRKR